MVPRVQATVVEQDVRERGPDPRSADEDAAPLLGRAHPPQTAHRLLVVDRGGGGGTMTSIDRNGIMTGFIWTMQVVDYPLFDHVGKDAFARYEAGHNRLFFRVAGPAILLTLLTAVLLPLIRPPQVPLATVVTGRASLRGGSGLDRAAPDPQHTKLANGFDPDAHKFLVRSNPTAPSPGEP